ncbi:Bestrophin, RFP-TM, chloride channel-domain-containing protein [Obelidium mucronatum]|nr:Bestrophin, RFP-TM, chloride channel-domain-containing protein [Obelidium mucronatum]
MVQVIPMVVIDNSHAKEEAWEPTQRKPVLVRSFKRTSKTRWEDVFDLAHSVLPKVILASTGLTLWSVVVCIFYLVPSVDFMRTLNLPNSTLLLSLLGTTVSLLLAFRVNTAYDRFWEGRKVWSTLHLNIRQTARLICVYCKPKNDSEDDRRETALKLLIGFASAVKHELRNENGSRYSDLGPYLPNGLINPKSHLKGSLQILAALQAYVGDKTTVLFPLTSAVNALNDCVSTFERIRYTPVPAAYTIHLHQALVVYMIGFPFQLVPSALGWFTIPVVAIISFVVLGVEITAQDIENPFGYDPNDLPQDIYCDTIVKEITELLERCDDPNNGLHNWIAPYSLERNGVDLKALKESKKQ